MTENRNETAVLYLSNQDVEFKQKSSEIRMWWDSRNNFPRIQKGLNVQGLKLMIPCEGKKWINISRAADNNS